MSKNFAYDLRLPTAGERDYYALNFELRGSYGKYWSSSPVEGDLSYAEYLHFDDTEVKRKRPSYRSNGFPVRCLKNSTWTVTFISGGEEFRSVEVKK